LKDEPDENAIATAVSSCTVACARRSRRPRFTGRSVKGDHGHNVPRFIVDLAAAFDRPGGD